MSPTCDLAAASASPVALSVVWNFSSCEVTSVDAVLLLLVEDVASVDEVEDALVLAGVLVGSPVVWVT